jgi:hypothetical protein
MQEVCHITGIPVIKKYSIKTKCYKTLADDVPVQEALIWSMTPRQA